MDHVVAALILGCFAIGQMLTASATSGQITGTQASLVSESKDITLTASPAAPGGKSTVLGGEIRNIDLVRDQFTLKAFGQRPMKILFDERTQIYMDGKKIPLHDLHAASHASVQTILDKTNVFAVSIHMLTKEPEGEYQGRVLSFNPDTNELTVTGALSVPSIKLLVPVNTLIVRDGQTEISTAQPGSSELVNGALVSIKFKSDKQGGGVASEITILATPGSEFVFKGNLSSVDMHSGYMVLVDPRDGKDYQVFFDSARIPTSLMLHVGDLVKVTTSFNGDRYVASAISKD